MSTENGSFDSQGESVFMQRLDPQPVIAGSYVNDGDLWHYCEKPDIDRICGPAPIWKTLRCPFGENGVLTSVDGEWFWKRTESQQQLKTLGVSRSLTEERSGADKQAQGMLLTDAQMASGVGSPALPFDSPSQSLGEWQPIETVPRTGKMVLMWSSDNGFFAGNWPQGYAAGKWDNIDGHWRGGSRREALEATHWAPLPDPPNT